MVAQKPAIDGWFTTDAGDGEPHLLGSRCTTCGTFFFPRADFFCRNPVCDGTTFDEVPLSNRGRVWSWTVNRYQPPPPYVSPAGPDGEFRPFGIAAVVLAEEKMVVLGQVAHGAEVAVGDEVELVVDTLFTDEDGTEQLVWKWSPVR
jgi:uncharacterized OB-fold protein